MSDRQLYPALDDATEAALRASVERFGVLVPVVVDQHGELLDGHHRSRIAGELGVEFETVVRQVADEVEAREIARTLNEDRRMLTRKQRLPVVRALKEEGHSNVAIGKALGVTEGTVRLDLKTDEVRRSTNLPAEVTGLDGKTYPASKPKPKPTNGKRGYRKDKDAPFNPSSERQEQVARQQLRRLADGLSEINGICRGFRDLDLGIAAAASSNGEIETWAAKAGELSRALRDLKTRLTEVSKHGA